MSILYHTKLKYHSLKSLHILLKTTVIDCENLKRLKGDFNEDRNYI
jgi:hypothetical protein